MPNKTLYESFREIANENKSKTAVMWKENKRWKRKNYKTILREIDAFASALEKMKVKEMDRVAIFSENRKEWLISDFAINKIGAISVPIHTTSNEDTFHYCLKDSDTDLVIASEKCIEKLNSWKKIKKLRIISFDGDKKAKGCKNFYFYDLIESNQRENVDTRKNKKDIASIVYTSGTTGEPKGVILTNTNFISNIEGVYERLEIRRDDLFLSFLPLSHVLERTATQFVATMRGATIAYCEGIKKITDNMMELNPTIIVSVPKIFEKFYEKVLSELKKNPKKEKLFYWALKKKTFLARTFGDKVVLKKVRNKFGKNLRFAVSGGASIDSRIIKFFDKLGVNVIEGYGLTETSPIIGVNSLDDKKVGTIGKPLENVEVKIGHDKELLVRGPSITSGYWKKKEMTAEAIDKDAWFHTGDLVFMDSERNISIIGRKKEIIVTNNGKDVAPERIESSLNLSPYILQSVVIGHKKPFLSALIVPDQEALVNTDIDTNSIDELTSLIQKEVHKINKELMHHEQIEKFILMRAPFTLEAGELTPTMKIRRSIIENKCHNLIKGIYEK